MTDPVQLTDPQPPTDREKWAAECRFRDRELLVKEREQAASTWRSPLTLAVLAAAVGAFSNAYIARQNGTLQRALESQRATATSALEVQRAEDSRILEVIRTGDPDKAAVNLHFLLDTGLISDGDRSARMRDFLAKRPPGSGPALSLPGNCDRDAALNSNPHGVIDFGQVPVGTSVERQFMIENLGRGELAVEVIFQPGYRSETGAGNDTAQFAIIGPTPFQVSCGAQRAVTLRFTAKRVGKASAQIRIQTIDGRFYDNPVVQAESR